MKVKEESEKVDLKVNIQKTVTAASQCIHSFILNWGFLKNFLPFKGKTQWDKVACILQSFTHYMKNLGRLQV